MPNFYILDVDEVSPAIIVAAMEADAPDAPELADLAQRYADQVNRQVVLATWEWVVRPTVRLVVNQSVLPDGQVPPLVELAAMRPDMQQPVQATETVGPAPKHDGDPLPWGEPTNGGEG